MFVQINKIIINDTAILALFCPTPRVALLVVDLSPSQSLLLWFAQHLDSSSCPARLSQPFLILRLALVIVQMSLTAF